MNADDRKRLEKIINALGAAKDELNDLASDEQEKFDNLSEGLQAAESGQKLEESANALSEALSDLENVLDALNGVE